MLAITDGSTSCHWLGLFHKRLVYDQKLNEKPNVPKEVGEGQHKDLIQAYRHCVRHK